MKRQHSSDEVEDEKPAKSGRKNDDQQLDLNATPRGFDLNAPFPEEDWSCHETLDEASIPTQDSTPHEIFSHQLESAVELGIDEELDSLHAIWSAYSRRNAEQIDEILAAICEEISKFPAAPPKYQYLTCFYVAKKLPAAFHLPKTFKLVISFLEANSSANAVKKPSFLPIFACRLLYRAFSESGEWPLEFVKVYLEDAINTRSWVDNEMCKEFIANILTAFREDDQDIGLVPDDAQGPPEKSDQQATVIVKNRYSDGEVRQKAKLEFIQALNQFIRAPSVKENPRLLFRFFTLGIWYEEVRVIASSMLEIWLNNPVHFRGAKMLLDRLMHHTHGTTSKDFETVANLLSFRLNNQAISQAKSTANNLYADIVVQVVQKRSEYITVALKSFITSDISSKGSQNMKGILAVIKALPDSLSPERELALAIKDLALSEDHGTQLQDFVARLIKHLRDVSPFLLTRALLEPWHPLEEQNESTRVKCLKQLTGLACRLLIQSAAPFASDEKFMNTITAQEQSQNEAFNDHFNDYTTKVMKFQIDALNWCTDVLNAHLPYNDSKMFSGLVRMLMFLEPCEEYHFYGDNDLNCFQLAAYSMHASEEILARVILMGISSQFPMAQEDALDIIEKLVWRAAAAKKDIYGTLSADSVQLPAAVIKLSSFALPIAPRQQIVVKDMYWKSCLVILALAVFNPSGIGRHVWENFPAIKFLMEFLITEREYTSSCDDQASQTDQQVEEAIEALLQQEQSINTQLGQWRGNVMFQSHQTRPPGYIFEELAEIEKLYSLARQLRACRSPNFVHDIVSSQDFKQAWAWIKKILSTEQQIVGQLPYDWQCKLLYIHESSTHQRASISALIGDVQRNLGKLFTDGADGASGDVVKFLSGKLSSKNAGARSRARKCFSGVLGAKNSSSNSSSALEAESSSEENCSAWLGTLEKLNSAHALVPVLVSSLQEALASESSIHVIGSYLEFLEKHLSPTSLALTIARFLVNRSLLARSLLLRSTEMISSSAEASTTSCADLILECFSKISSGASDAWEASDSPQLKLVSPQQSGPISVNFPRVVLEAMVEALRITSEAEKSRKSEAYGGVLKLLFPGFLSDEEGDSLMSFIESESGEKLEILSEDQAVRLAKCKDTRLAKAGLSKLKSFKKLEILQELGLCPDVKTQILNELEALSSSSASEVVLRLSEWQRLFLRGLYPETSASPLLSCLREFKQGSDEKNSTRNDEPAPQTQATIPEKKKLTEDGVKATIQSLFERSEQDEGSYVSLRNSLQKAALSASEELLEWLRSSLNQLSFSDNSHAARNSASLVFPVLVLLHRAASKPNYTVKQTKMILNWMSSGASESVSFSACLERIKKLEKQAVEALGGELAALGSSEAGEALVSYAPRHLQKLLHGHLRGKLQVQGILEASSSSSSSRGIFPLVERLLSLEARPGLRAEIELSGRYALLLGVLSCLDPSLSWCFQRKLEENNNELGFKLSLFLVLHYAAQNFSRGSMIGFGDELWAEFTKAFNLNSADSKQLQKLPFHLAAPLVLEFLSACTRSKIEAGSKVLSETWTNILSSCSVASCNSSSSPEAGLSTSLKVLVDVCENRHAMDGLIRHLNSLIQSKISEDMKSSARNLIFGLYVAYPAPVGRLLTNGGSWENVSCKPGILKNSNAYCVTRRAINSAFTNTSNSSASGFCYYVAANHPAFLIFHISTLRLNIREKLRVIKETNGEQKNLLTNLLIFTIEMLDSSRPFLLQIGSSHSSIFREVFPELDSLLVLYFQVFDDPYFDKLPFGKLASKLAEFLLHCIIAGGKFSDMVFLHHQRAEAALQRFSQARKVSSFLQRLRSSPASSSSSISSTSLELEDLDRAVIEKIEQVKRQVSAVTSLRIPEHSDDEWSLTKPMENDDVSNESLLSTLTDLETASVHLPGILSGLQDTLIALLRIGEPSTSEKAFRLIQTLVKYNSRESGPKVAAALLEQLASNRASCVEVASRHVSGLFHHCGELQEHILMELFHGGKHVNGPLLQLISESFAFA